MTMQDSGIPKRVFAAAFAHETNTFHPAVTRTLNFWDKSRLPFPGLDDPRVVIIPGVCAHPDAGGTVDGAACRDAMYAEGIGPAECVLVSEARSIVGPAVPIACTFRPARQHPCSPGTQW